MKKLFFSLISILFFLNYLPSFATCGLHRDAIEVNSEEISESDNEAIVKQNDLKERKKQKKKKGKSKIIIRPDDEDIILTLDREIEEDEDSSGEE